MTTVLNWLESQPGESWQARWLASGAEDHRDWQDLVAAWKMARSGVPPARLPPHIGGGLTLLGTVFLHLR